MGKRAGKSFSAHWGIVGGIIEMLSSDFQIIVKTW